MKDLLINAKHILDEFKSIKTNNSTAAKNLTNQDLAKYFDHTLLSNDATPTEIEKYTLEAINADCASICVHPAYIDVAQNILREHKQTKVKLCAVASFPLGANLINTKLSEIRVLSDLGVEEIDFVAPIYLIKTRNWSALEKEFSLIRAATSTCLKVILETCLLSDLEKIIASLIAINCGINFLKTSSGFSKSGATIKDIRLLKLVASGKVKIKASGGIKTKRFALDLITAGADRIGASQSISIINEKYKNMI
ncbi:MAG: deoxyribose-phosphate aldolase [SAR324 cluster bacterium]|nr:deoxyribose-phosphate aldolase [SAR324 cluster bacterium]